LEAIAGGGQPEKGQLGKEEREEIAVEGTAEEGQLGKERDGEGTWR
jgi:hypothetical protein